MNDEELNGMAVAMAAGLAMAFGNMVAGRSPQEVSDLVGALTGAVAGLMDGYLGPVETARCFVELGEHYAEKLKAMEGGAACRKH